MIHELGQNQYLVSGEVSVIDRNTIEITELPVRTWTQARSSSTHSFQHFLKEVFVLRLTVSLLCPCAVVQGVCAGAHVAGNGQNAGSHQRL